MLQVLSEMFEPALKLMPDYPDMMYVRAAALYFASKKQAMSARSHSILLRNSHSRSSSSSRRFNLDNAKHQQIAADFQVFLDKHWITANVRMVPTR